MVQAILSVFCLLLASSVVLCDEVLTQKIKDADELFNATLFEKAIVLYQEFLTGEEEKSVHEQEHARLKLAQSFFSIGQYLESLVTLKKAFTNHEMQLQSYCIQGLSCQKLEKIDEAIIVFKNFLEVCTDCSHPLWPIVQYQLGILFYGKKDFQIARMHFETIKKEHEIPQNYLLAQIYLARIELAENKPMDAAERLKGLESFFNEDTPLKSEWSHVLGEVFFEMKEYAHAAAFFERAIPSQNYNQASWIAETLYGLALSYAKLVDGIKTGSQVNGEYYANKSENLLKELITLQPSSKVYLSLAQLYVTKAEKLGDKTSLCKVSSLLGQPGLFSTTLDQAHALYILALAAENPQESYELYKRLIDDIYKDSPFYALAWYSKGMHEYQAGLNFLADDLRDEGKDELVKAAHAFQACFNLSKLNDKKLAALSAKFQAQAYGSLGTMEGRIQAITVLNMLIDQYPEVLSEYPDPGEFFYLQGLMASYAAKWDEGDPFMIMAEKSLMRCLNDFPASTYADRTLFTLGGVYFYKKLYPLAEQTFIKLAYTYPNSEIVGDAYFWAAKSSDAQNLGNETAKGYKRKVYDEYPYSAYAAEAYFTFFTYREYVQGDRLAIKHLQAFKDKFPNSPYTITASYLIGMDLKRDRKTLEGKWVRKKNMSDAIEAFQEAETSFEKMWNFLEIPLEQRKYFINVKYRSALERALANLSIADESQGAKKRIFLEYAIEVLNKVNQDFQNQDHPYAQHLSKNERYHPVQEECHYWLSQAYMKLLDDEKASKILSEMIERYRSAKITKGYFLARVWYDLGTIAFNRKNYHQALQFFGSSEDAAKGRVLNTDQKIDLWIQQSLCHKELKQFDKAMLILSKAINDDAISSLRVKAMYLRAELYALQGRQELAKKQLEATSKKGGEWAMKAKIKLNEDYGN